MENLFIAASRKKIRFSTGRGLLATEDLWELSLEDLDRLAVQAHDELERSDTKSFIGRCDTKRTEREIRFGVLKRVIDTKLAEREAAKAQADAHAQRQFLESLIAKKSADDLASLSLEELQARLAALQPAETPA